MQWYLDEDDIAEYASIFYPLYHKLEQKSISYVILKTKNLIDTIHYVV